MKVVKEPGKLVLTSGFVEYWTFSSSLKARKIEFDYFRQEARIFRGRLFRSLLTIPFSDITRVYHRIYADLDSLLLVDDSRNRTGHSSLSVVFLEIHGKPNEIVYVENYYGMDSASVRKTIRRIQGLVDEITLITDKPLAIECEEVGFFVDLGRREVLLPGRRVPLSEVSLFQVVEAPNGYFSVTVYTKDGEGTRTVDGYDKTVKISDTVRMIAEKAHVSFHFVRDPLETKLPEPTVTMESKPEESTSEKIKRVARRAFLD